MYQIHKKYQLYKTTINIHVPTIPGIPNMFLGRNRTINYGGDYSVTALLN